MVSLKKYVPCKCGAANSFDFSSDMSVEDITVSARCPSCQSSITISISSLLSSPAQQPSPSVPDSPSVSGAEQAVSEISQEHTDKETTENVEQAVRDLFKY